MDTLSLTPKQENPKKIDTSHGGHIHQNQTIIIPQSLIFYFKTNNKLANFSQKNLNF
jgi:hypothetical protein